MAFTLIYFSGVYMAFHAIRECITPFKEKKIKVKEILMGFGISLTIFGLIVLSYLIEGKRYFYSPSIRIAVFMIMVPYIIQGCLKYIKKPKVQHICLLLLISIVISGIAQIVFTKFFVELVAQLGLPVRH